jgi:hypothetical protein
MDISAYARSMQSSRCAQCPNLTECQLMTSLVEMAESGCHLDFPKQGQPTECQIGLQEFKNSIPFQVFSESNECRFSTLGSDELCQMKTRLLSCWNS